MTKQPDQYENIGEEFQKKAPKLMLRQAILTPTFMETIGDIEGASILDLACGDGYYTRLMREARAGRVVGVDVSTKMISLAKDQEAKLHQDIEYLAADITALPDLGEFDLVTAVFLLHYASSKEELLKMCQAIFKSTAQDGRFITINTNPDHALREDNTYSFTRVSKEPLHEGGVLTLTHYDGDKPVYSFDFYHWSKETYEEALQTAGFSNVQWDVPHISDEAMQDFGPEFWQDYIAHPNHSVIICQK